MLRGVRQWWRGKSMGLRSLARIAPNLREPVRFSLRQITRRHGLRAYRLRGSEVRIFVRHSTGDLITLEEVLAERQYEPPAQLAELFARNGKPLNVADVGANTGLFTAWVLARRPDARIVAFEPDPANAAVLEQCVRANGDGAQVVRAAAATRAGRLRFQVGELAASHQVESGGVEVDAVDVFPYLERADLVKLDIEGGEWPILADPRLAALPGRALVVEYHPHLCQAPDPRAEAERLLTAAGWKVEHMDFDMPPGHGVVWAWR